MGMHSFVATISEFFRIEKERQAIFDTGKNKYIIPKYQREYTWKTEKVQTLISDINNSNKFLGNLILYKTPDSYEIVDGQQRITTIMLIFIALFNLNKLSDTEELSEEQRYILRYIYQKDHFVLENESIGDFIHLSKNELSIKIDESEDIYYQKDTFMTLYQTIIDNLGILQNKDLLSFQRKLLNCEVLVLIGEEGGLHNESIEEVFLDINFKSQLLDAADIFKGYCFKNYAPCFFNDLKKLWIEIRKYIKKFETIGYTNEETCEYIYHYLLSCPDTYQIPMNLLVNGKHYLDGKNNTETKRLLLDMVSYGKNITTFWGNLCKTTYIFEDICANAEQYKTDTINQNVMKHMFRDIMFKKNIQYHKFPLFMFLNYLMENNDLREAFDYKDLKKFITNYYAYSFFFINSRGNKKKCNIDRTIFSKLYEFDNAAPASEVIKGVLSSTQQLRKNYLKEYEQSHSCSQEKLYALYSLMDNYNPADNYLNCIYAYPSYNSEHLIIHSNRECSVIWEETGRKHTIRLKQLLGRPEGEKYRATRYRNLNINYIILPVELNTVVDQKDIVEKVTLIQQYYSCRNLPVPKHVQIFLEHIESLDEYKMLSGLKEKSKPSTEIESSYVDFVEAYFSEERQRALNEKLKYALQRSFQN